MFTNTKIRTESKILLITVKEKSSQSIRSKKDTQLSTIFLMISKDSWQRVV